MERLSRAFHLRRSTGPCSTCSRRRRNLRLLSKGKRPARIGHGVLCKLFRLQRASIFRARTPSSNCRRPSWMRASRWRTGAAQNYVGSLAPDYSAIVHYVSPKPQDLSLLMHGWMRSMVRVEASEVNAVCAAAIAGFGFVYLHPFEDGNGRLHRFLIHHSLAKLGFTPPGVLFPVSAAMLRNRHVYDQALEFFSRSIRPLLDCTVDDMGRMEVG